jgi:diadenosine tetraphosphatase ApaH/serine/threonine PP2A family protein phosphatase
VRVAVLSDIHANLVALEAVLSAVGSIDAVWHLGDVVGYGPEPDGVVERLRTVGAEGVAGNHDLAAVGGKEIDSFNPEAKAAMAWTRGRIGDATRTWLAALTTTRQVSGMSLVHGSPRDPVWEYITSVPIARANLAVLETPIGLHGHTHVPMAWADRDGRVEPIAPGPGSSFRLDGGPALLNPGSVGQPRDGDSRAAYAIADLPNKLITLYRVAYPIETAQKKILEAGLPPMLAYRLGMGR